MAKKVRSTPTATPIIDEKSTPEAKGDRLQRVRQFAGFRNLKDITEKYGEEFSFSEGGWRNWESGCYPLTPAGAEKAHQLLKREGILCSVEYLLHGTLPGPQTIEPDTLNPTPSTTEKLYKAHQDIINELMLFREQHPNAVDIIMPDDSMLPIYEKGDYLAGMKATGRDRSKVIGKLCIVQTVTGKTGVRKVLEKTANNQFTLTCLNQSAPGHFPVFLEHAELNFVAPILWRRIPIF